MVEYKNKDMKAITINSQVKFLEEFDFFQFEENTYFNLKDIDEETLYKWGFRTVTKPTITASQKYKEPLAPEDFNTEKDEFIYQIVNIPALTDEAIKLQAIQETKLRYENHKAQGWEAYQNFRANIVSDIAEEIITEPQAFAIEELLSVAYDKISASGDWKTALYKLSQVVIPQGYEFVQPYYDAAHQELETYIVANYE